MISDGIKLVMRALSKHAISKGTKKIGDARIVKARYLCRAIYMWDIT